MTLQNSLFNDTPGIEYIVHLGDSFHTTLFAQNMIIYFTEPDYGLRAVIARGSQNVRRVHLARVHYHLYYYVTPEPGAEVLALWHQVVETLHDCDVPV